MNKLYNKSELWFAITWIIIYILGTLILDNIAAAINIVNFLTPIFYLLLCIILIIWICKNNYKEKFGLCKSPFNAKYFLYFIPLLILISINFWFGINLTNNLIESVLFIISMLCVGFLEEIIFRGFLFKAMEKDSLKWAIVVSSLTFGFGHIINLFSANADIVNTILQICYATTTGFLFVIIFYKGKTLLPCIVTHSLFNTLSLFAKGTSLLVNIIITIVMMALTIIYSIILIKILPKEQSEIKK